MQVVKSEFPSLSVEPVHDGGAPVIVVGAAGAEVDAARQPDRRARLDVARRRASDLRLRVCNMLASWFSVMILVCAILYPYGEHRVSFKLIINERRTHTNVNL